jgi:putative MFS transporter
MEKNSTQSVLLVDQLTPARRFYTVLGILAAALAFEVFDFFIVGYLVSVIAPAWKLTFGQSAIVLLSAGVGAILGAGAAGPLADRYGRRLMLILGSAIFPLAAAAISFIPEGDWISFALLRLLVGLGYGFAGVPQFALIVEYTPTRLRTLVASASMIPIGLGFVMAPFAMTFFYSELGWRGLAALGIIPIIFVPIFMRFIPESPTWLMARNKPQQAVDAAAKLFGVDRNRFSLPERAVPSSRAAKASGSVLDHPRQLAFTVIAYGFNAAATAGVMLWGPLMVGMLLNLTPQMTAGYFIIVSISGLVGRFAFTFLSHKIGRRPTGQLTGLASGALIVLGALMPEPLIFGVPLFVVTLVVAAFFFDGGLANLQPHAAEIFPVEVAARGMAVSQVAVSAGKIIGPIILAVLAGTSNVVMPAATRAAVTPGFLCMASFFVVTGVAFMVLGTETNRYRKTSKSLPEAV